MSENDNATVSFLDRYAPSQPEPENEYQAISLTKMGGEENGIRIHEANGRIELISYAYVMRVICTSHQAVALILTDGAIMLLGENLTGMVEYIQDRKIRSLHCYRPDQDGELPAGEPVIYTIQRMDKDAGLAA